MEDFDITENLKDSDFLHLEHLHDMSEDEHQKHHFFKSIIERGLDDIETYFHCTSTFLTSWEEELTYMEELYLKNQ